MTGYREPTERDVSGGALRPKTIMEPVAPETPTTRYAEAMATLSVAQDDMMRDVIRGVMGSEIERAIDTTIGPSRRTATNVAVGKFLVSCHCHTPMSLPHFSARCLSPMLSLIHI